MNLYKISNSIAQQLAKMYDITTLRDALRVAEQASQGSNQSVFSVGQKLTYTKDSGYRGWCTVQEVNSDGTLLILDHSGRQMGQSGSNGFKPIQMGKKMFEEM